jgi:hypothetical protein
MLRKPPQILQKYELLPEYVHTFRLLLRGLSTSGFLGWGGKLTFVNSRINLTRESGEARTHQEGTGNPQPPLNY